MTYRLIQNNKGKPIKAWVEGVDFDPKAELQLRNMASLPIVFQWVAAMPDVHLGKGATVGSVVPTKGAIIPAAVGVDIGCGMMAVQTDLNASRLPDNLSALRSAIEKAVPHGRSSGRAGRDKGAWGNIPKSTRKTWKLLEARHSAILEKHQKIAKANSINHLGTLGSGNHFIEVCLDEAEMVWFMLHSGSRGVGNRIGNHFIWLAREDMRVHKVNLPDKDLAYLSEGTRYFDDYVEAVGWAQDFARHNRELMMENLIAEIRGQKILPEFKADVKAVNCHHNYVEQETHYGEKVWLTRKGAVHAAKGKLGIIPGSMGARSYIVRGLGNPESYESCSHGAGRMLSRTQAKKRFSVDDHIRATAGVECRKDEGVIDETPGAYKPIDAVMRAQKDLVEVVHTLKQVVCVKG